MLFWYYLCFYCLEGGGGWAGYLYEMAIQKLVRRWSDLGYMIFIRHLAFTTAVTNLIFGLYETCFPSCNVFRFTLWYKNHGGVGSQLLSGKNKYFVFLLHDDSNIEWPRKMALACVSCIFPWLKVCLSKFCLQIPAQCTWYVSF